MVALGMGQITAETIESKVGVDAIVPIPGATPTELTHIDLTTGFWLVSGQINFYESAEKGTVFVGGNISQGTVAMSTDGTTLWTSQELTHRTNIILGVALPGHLIKVGPGQTSRVYVACWSNSPMQPAPVCSAWGFISATKVGFP